MEDFSLRRKIKVKKRPLSLEGDFLRAGASYKVRDVSNVDFYGLLVSKDCSLKNVREDFSVH